MKGPEFLVVGAQKAGTTSLHEYLRQHPQLFLPERKEPHYFCSTGDGTPMDWRGPGDDHLLSLFTIDEHSYEALFADAAGRPRGESSTAYFHDPLVPERVARANPDVRVVVLLRDPVARAESAWWMWHRAGVEPLPFAEALAAEDDRLAAGWGPTFAYRGVGTYATHLARWRRHLDPDHILVLRSDDLRDRRLETVQRVFGFLGVDPSFRPDVERDENRALPPRARPSALSKVLLRPTVRSIGRRLTSHRARQRMLPLLRKPGRPRPPLDESLAAELRAWYRPEMVALGTMLEWDVSDWTDPRG